MKEPLFASNNMEDLIKKYVVPEKKIEKIKNKISKSGMN